MDLPIRVESQRFQLDQDHIHVFVPVRAVPPHEVHCKAELLLITPLSLYYSITTNHNKSVHIANVGSPDVV